MVPHKPDLIIQEKEYKRCVISYPKWLQHTEQNHWEDEQVCGSSDRVLENMGPESIGNTSHSWNSWQEHSKLPPEDIRQVLVKAD